MVTTYRMSVETYMNYSSYTFGKKKIDEVSANN